MPDQRDNSGDKLEIKEGTTESTSLDNEEPSEETHVNTEKLNVEKVELDAGTVNLDLLKAVAPMRSKIDGGSRPMSLIIGAVSIDLDDLKTRIRKGAINKGAFNRLMYTGPNLETIPEDRELRNPRMVPLRTAYHRFNYKYSRAYLRDRRPSVTSGSFDGVIGPLDQLSVSSSDDEEQESDASVFRTIQGAVLKLLQRLRIIEVDSTCHGSPQRAKRNCDYDDDDESAFDTNASRHQHQHFREEGLV
jgi:hypothetical protein